MMKMHSENLRKPTTAGNIVYLLLSFPMGLIYFLITVFGLSIGLSTLVLWIGLPVLFGTFFAIRGMAELERRLVVSLLRFPIPYYQHRRECETRRTFLRYFSDMLRDPHTWTSTLYMLLKLPLGIFSLTLALVLPIVATAITFLPVVYLINLFVNTILLKNGIQSTGYIIPSFIQVHGTFDPVMFLRSFVGVPVGLLLCFITRFVLNSLAIGSGELAHALLGPGETASVAQQVEYQTMPYMTGYYEQPFYRTQENHS